MSGEKTHSATPRRRREARKKGQVLKSSELSTGIVFLGMFLLLKFWLPTLMTDVANFSSSIFQHQPLGDFTPTLVRKFTTEAAVVVAKGLAPILLGSFILSILANYVQVGTLFTLKPLLPDFQRINPIAGFQRLFSVRSLIELVKSVLKLALLSYLVYETIINNLKPRLPEIYGSSLGKGLSILGDCLTSLTWKVALVFVILGIADYFYQWWEFERSLKMSHQELKEEYKTTEGDPHVKGEIKRKQRAMANKRMMQEVPKADVIITNPTHFAVALRYDSSSMQAPLVVAKGQGEVAKRIKELASEHKVPLVENPPLARSLFRNVEIGEPVPPQLYKAVAEVLAFVYRLNRKRIS